MIAINLLPETCVRERRIRVRTRRWAVAATLTAMSLFASYLWLSGLWDVGLGGLAEDLERAERRLADAKREQAKVQASLVEADAARRALDAVSDLPDWGLLLNLLAQQGGGRATLTACTLAIAKSDAASAPKGRVGRFVLTIQGLVEDPKSATDFAVDLESTHVFERVNLVDTMRTSAQGRELLSFRIECAMTDPAGEMQP